MTQVPVDFTLDTLTRKKIEKCRRKQKDARLHNRLSALLWLSQGRSTDEVAQLLGLCPHAESKPAGAVYVSTTFVFKPTHPVYARPTRSASWRMRCSTQAVPSGLR